MDISRSVLEAFTMANKSVRYTPEFKRQMVELVRSGRTPASLAKESCGSSRTRGTQARAMAV